MVDYKDGSVVVRAKWTVDIGLDSQVVEHLTSDARVPCSIHGPALYFHLYFFVRVHSSHTLVHIFYMKSTFEKESRKKRMRNGKRTRGRGLKLCIMVMICINIQYIDCNSMKEF